MKELLRRPLARLLLLAAGIALLLWLAGRLLSVLTPFAVAFAIAYFLNPAVNAMERFFEGDIARSRLLKGRLNARAASVGILALLVVLVLGLAVFFGVPALYNQVEEAVSKLPAYMRTLRERIEPAYQSLNLRYPEQTEELRRRLETAVRENLPGIVAPVTRAIQTAFSSVVGFVLTLLNVFIVPVFAVYLLWDMNRIREGTKELVPQRFRGYVYARLQSVDRLLSAFVRGQITVALILGSFYSIALTACGVPMGLLVGFVIGFFNLVPFLSHVVGLPLALVLSWLDDQSPQRLLLVAGVFAFGQFTEGNFITPRIVGQSVGLHAVIMMLAVLVGGTLFGIVGMLVAVPVTAALSVFWADLREAYLRSEFYRGPA